MVFGAKLDGLATRSTAGVAYDVGRPSRGRYREDYHFCAYKVLGGPLNRWSCFIFLSLSLCVTPCFSHKIYSFLLQSTDRRQLSFSVSVPQDRLSATRADIDHRKLHRGPLAI